MTDINVEYIDATHVNPDRMIYLLTLSGFKPYKRGETEEVSPQENEKSVNVLLELLEKEKSSVH